MYLDVTAAWTLRQRRTRFQESCLGGLQFCVLIVNTSAEEHSARREVTGSWRATIKNGHCPDNGSTEGYVDATGLHVALDCEASSLLISEVICQH